MLSTSEQFITQMKLRELRAQRDHSLVAYDALSGRVAQARDDSEALRLLYNGLQQLTFAKQPLHPDVTNLGLLLRSMEGNRASNETLAFWRVQLQRELERGRLRAEIVYIFGALLEEWATRNAREVGTDPREQEATNALIERAIQPSATVAFAPMLNVLISDLDLDSPEAVSKLRDMVRQTIYARIKPSELHSVLKQISEDVYRTKPVRRQAHRFLLNATLTKELADALTIQLDHLDEWDWPEAGVSSHAGLSRTKWRLFLEEELPTACLLEILGSRWQRVFEQALGWREEVRLQRFHHLLELGAPKVILENEQRFLRNVVSTKPRISTDIWTDTGRSVAEPRPDAGLDEQVRYWGEQGSVFAHRATIQSELHEFGHFRGYRSEEYSGGMDRALTLINAEIVLGRAAFPQKQLYIVKTDLKDYYPSLAHDLLLAILARTGLSQGDIEFFQRYLRVRLRRDEKVLLVQSGAPAHRALSDLLGELVLRLLDQHVQRAARVHVIRVVDDICLIAASSEEAIKGWQAVQEFCTACGLTINEEKSGSVAIGGMPLPTLPQADPRWLFIALDADGQWGVDGQAFDAYLEKLHGQIADEPSILGRIQTYNAAVIYLRQAFMLKAPLGASHRQSVHAAMSRLQSALFEDGRGLAESVREGIHERFLGGVSMTQVPEAWLYWPITAGGLGLRHPTTLAATYAESYAKRVDANPPRERTADWQRRKNGWGDFYASLLTEVEPIEPASTQVMETLVSDFIHRREELTTGKQGTISRGGLVKSYRPDGTEVTEGISPYWHWVLYLYGPQILERLGTFRFLFSELVPLQLVTQRHVTDADANEDKSGRRTDASSDTLF